MSRIVCGEDKLMRQKAEEILKKWQEASGGPLPPPAPRPPRPQASKTDRPRRRGRRRYDVP
jgi:hypothetical protein